MEFQPDYRNLVDAAYNREPKRVPLYDHVVSDKVIEQLTGRSFRHLFDADNSAYFREFCDFFRQSGYDGVPFEVCITEILPFGGALAHPQAGHIQDRETFLSYPFDEVPALYIQRAQPRFDALRDNLPQGMKAYGGIGNGVFEIAQDLCGYETLCILSFEDPETYAELFVKIGDMMEKIWDWFLNRYREDFCVMRFGDDLGYKSNTMLSYEDIRTHIIPQYRRIIQKVHETGRPFLLHSCGCIFEVMEDLISAGIDAKHSNEDQIAPFSAWVEKYGDRIGNFGGIDTDHIVRMTDEELVSLVTDLYNSFSKGHGGFAIGSGNSIPDYVNPQKYRLMTETVRKLRGDYR